MLHHKYWIIRNAALESIKRHGNEDDLKQFLNAISGKLPEKQGLIEAICIIDEKLFPLKS